nr:MAG TPA: hypothetical protein [Caudoviricetes sp.]
MICSNFSNIFIVFTHVFLYLFWWHNLTRL